VACLFAIKSSAALWQISSSLTLCLFVFGLVGDPGSGVGFVPADHLVGRVAFVFFSSKASRNDAKSYWLPCIRWARIGLALE
jgi:hypothetical protein